LRENLNFRKEMKKLRSLEHIRKYSRQQEIYYMDKEITNKYRVGCVYFIQETQTKNIKIGWCWNLPRRIQTLQVANSQNLTVVWKELTQFPYKKEQRLHLQHKDHHIRGEWYSADVLS
jgi:hypothetical protein